MSNPEVLFRCRKHLPLPPGTVYQRNHHLLATRNFTEPTGFETSCRIIQTGWPESKNQLTAAPEALDLFFKVHSLTAYAQVNLGPSFTPKQWQRNLAYALQTAPTKTDVMVYSAGAQALANLPPDAVAKIRKLIIVAPFTGQDVLKGTAVKIASSLFGIYRRTEDYIKAITDLANKVGYANITIFLREDDEHLDAAKIKTKFYKLLPHIKIVNDPGSHRISTIEINKWFEQY